MTLKVKVTWQDGSVVEGTSAKDVVAKMANTPWLETGVADPGHKNYMRGVLRRAGVFTGIYVIVPTNPTPEWFLEKIKEVGVAKVEYFGRSQTNKKEEM